MDWLGKTMQEQQRRVEQSQAPWSGDTCILSQRIQNTPTAATWSMRASRVGSTNCVIASMTCALLTVSPDCRVSGSEKGNLH